MLRAEMTDSIWSGREVHHVARFSKPTARARSGQRQTADQCR